MHRPLFLPSRERSAGSHRTPALRRPFAALTSVLVLFGLVGAVATATPAAAAVALSVNLSAPAEITAGTEMVWTVDVVNAGATAAQNVTVESSFPTMVEDIVITSADSGCTAFPCVLPTVPAGDTISFTATGQLDSFYTGMQVSAAINLTWPGLGPDQVGGEASDNAFSEVRIIADAAVTVTPDRPALRAGETVTWTIVVTNNGPSGAEIELVNPLPTDVVVTGFTSPAGLDCDLSYIYCYWYAYPGDERTFTLSGTVPADFGGESVANTSTVYPSSARNGDPVPSNNSATSTVNVLPFADLTLTATGPTSAVAGEEVTWNLELRNDGPAVAVPISLGAQFGAIGERTVSGGGCNALPCTLPSLAAGATINLTVTATVEPWYTGAILPLVATVFSATPEPGSDPNEGRRTTWNIAISSQADLRVTNTPVGGPFLPGGPAAWDIVVTNDGPSTARELAIIESAPAGLIGLTLAGPGVSCPAGQPCTVDELEPGDSVTVRATATIAPDFNSPTLSTTATVTSSTFDPTPANNSALSSITLPTTPDLTITKTGPATVVAGAPITWTVQVRNNGTFAVQDVLVEDVISTNVQGVVVSSPDSACTTFPCTLPTVGPGATVTFTITGTVDPYLIEFQLQNFAEISWPTIAPTQLGGGTNASSTTLVQAAADATVTVTPDRNTLLAGQSVTWTVLLTSNGPSRADVVLQLPTPDGIVIDAFTAPAEATCTAARVCALDSMAPGSQSTFTLTGTVPSAFTGPSVALTTTATVDARNGDPNPADNTVVSTVVVDTLADLSLTKTPVGAPFTAGGPAAWDIVVTNDGPSTARGLTITDTPPAALAGLLLTGPGVTCPAGQPCTLDALDPGDSVTVRAAGTIEPGYPASSIGNTAAVTSTTADPDPTDNSALSTGAVVTAADVAVTVTPSSPSVAAGEPISWTVVVVNNGPSTARGVLLTDLVPDGVDLDQVTAPDGIPCTDQIICDFGDLAPGTPLTFTLLGSVPAAATAASVINTAVVSTLTTDPTPGNNTATSLVSVTREADLTVSKTGPTTVVAGESITWTIDVSNDGPSVARNVTVTDVLPAGVTDVSVTGAGCDALPCTIPTLDPDGSVGLTVSGTVSPGLTGTAVVNTATVAGADLDPNPSDNSATAVTAIERSADLSLVKTVDQDPVVPGDELTYTLTVANAGPSRAGAISITDSLPPALLDATATTTAGTCDPVTDGTVLCTATGLDPDGTLVVTITGTVDEAVDAGSWANTAAVTAATADPDLTNNSGSVSVTTAPADLSITKTASMTEVAPEGSLTWTIEVANAGPAPARAAVLTDQLPTGVTIEAVATSQGTCGEPTDTLVCALGVVDADATVTVTVTGTVGADVQGSLTNTAAVVSPDDSDPSDNAAQVTVPVTAVADLQLTAAAGTASVVAGQTVDWSVTVTNAGPAATTGAVLTTPIPTGLTDVIAVGPTEAPDEPVAFALFAGTCAITEDEISCVVDDLQVGESFTVTFSAVVAPTLRGALVVTNSATGPLLDLRPADNVAEVTWQVLAETGLSVGKVAADPQVTVGDSTVYTISVANAGPSTATGVTVAELLPAGATVLDSSSEDFDVDTALWSVGDLDPLTSAELVLTVQLDTTGPAVNGVQVGSVEQPVGPTAAATVDVLAEAPSTTVDPTPSTTATAPPGPTATTQVTTTVPAATGPGSTTGPGLAHTGVRATEWLTWAVLLLVAGSATVLFARERSRRH